MNKQEALDFYKAYREKCNAYNLALATIHFDMSTIAPKQGNEYATKMISILSGELFDYSTNQDNMNKLYEMKEMDLGQVMNKEIRTVLKDLEKTSKLPREFYMKMQSTFAYGQVIWLKAKENADYSMFKDTLKEIIELTREAYTYYGGEGTLYDRMLNEFETGMYIEKYEEFFKIIKDRLVPFVHKVVEKKDYIDDSIFHEHYSREKQIEVMDVLKEYMGFDETECYLGESEHPFTTELSPYDVRITTKYLEDNLVSAIFSIIHEFGHATYALHVDDSLKGLVIGDEMTSGIHESQSRFMENYMGRRKSFWVNNYPKVQEIFPDQLKDVSLDEFIRMINVAKPTLVRTEADELTYPLHILIRYELEKEMINGEVDYDTLNKVWDDKYEEYLGIRPSNDKEGILQDIHWSSGDIGYFPTYALGSAFGAQFLKAMEKDLDIDKLLENNEFDKIKEWLRDHIHKYGALYDSQEIIKMCTGEEFDPNIYVDYLIDKYSKLYDIK